MSNYFAAVFGAGISGTAIANELNKRGKSVLLIDPYVSENAPGAPAGLVNPATGRRAKKSWESKKCMEALRNQLDELIEFAGKNEIMSDTGAIRPAINEDLAENFKDALEKYDWPKDWISWLEKDEVTDLNPNIAPNFGALYLHEGCTIFVDHYLNTYRKYLRKNGVKCKYEEADFFSEGDNFNIHFKNGDTAQAEHIIVAAGHQTPFFADWEFLPLHRVKGQIVWFEASEPLDWEHGISAMGYSLRRGERDLIVGSTYEHKFENLDTTEKAYHQIVAKLEKMLPGYKEKVSKKYQLAGVRVTTPDRLPVIGRHPEKRNLCIYTAMGSKGFLFSQYVGSLLAAHLAADERIPEEVDVKRFKYQLS